MARPVSRSHARPHSDWQPLPRLRAHEQVVAEIENRLNNGTLKAGDRLPPERQLAEALGVSRGAVREALRILGAIGVLDTGMGSGPASGSVIVSDGPAGMAMVLRMHLQLASFTQEDFAEVQRMIVPDAARRAAQRSSDSTVDELRATVRQMRETNSDNQLQNLKAELLTRIVRGSGNRLASLLMSGLTATQQCSWPEQSGTDECAAIVEAIAVGDADLAADLVTRYLVGGDPVVAGGPQLRRAG